MPNTYALRVVVTLPTGPRTYDLFPRETAEERADSLAQLELLDDLIASVEEDDETAIRTLLSETATGEEEAYELEVTQDNYLVLCAIIDHLVAESETEEPQAQSTDVKPEPQETQELAQTTEVDQQLEGAAIEKLIKKINKAERVLGIEISDKEALKTKSRKELKELRDTLEEKIEAALTGIIAGTPPKSTEGDGSTTETAATSTTEASTEAEADTSKVNEPDTTVAEVAKDLQSPLLSSEGGTAVEQTTESTRTDSTTADLETLRKAAGSLLNSEFRKSLRRGGR